MEKRSLNLLYNIASVLPSNGASETLKSYYYTKCRMLETHQDAATPKVIRCGKCNIPYSENQKICRLHPETKPGRFIRKLATKVKEGKPLTRYQSASKKRIAKSSAHFLVTTCAVCKNDFKRCFKKPPKPTPSPTPKAAVTNNNNNNLKTDSNGTANKKRKKKKDKFCGLNKQAVLSAVIDKSNSEGSKNKKIQKLLNHKANKGSIRQSKEQKCDNSPGNIKKGQFKAKNHLLKIDNMINQNKKNVMLNNSLNKLLTIL